MFAVGFVGDQPAEVDDAAHAGLRRGGREMLGGLQVQAAEVGAGGHGMDEVVGGVHTLQRGGQGFGLQRIGDHDFHPGPVPRVEDGARAPGRTHRHAFAQQPRHQVGADIAAGTEDQHPAAAGFHIGTGLDAGQRLGGALS